MFQQPRESGDAVPFGEMVGSLVLFDCRELRTGIPTTFGEKEAVAATVHCLDGQHGGEVFEDALIFPGALIGALKGAIGGEPVLGRIGLGTPKPNQKPPYLLQPFTDADAAVAGPYWTRHQAGKLQQPAQAAPAPAPVQQQYVPPQPAAPAPAANGAAMDVAVWDQLPPEVQALMRQSDPAKVPAGR
jgi:hypothetical protein